MSVWTTTNSSGLETPSKSTTPTIRAARSSAVITATGNHQQHHFQHVVAAAVAAATSVATGHQFQQQFPLHAHPHSHPHPHHNNSPTGSGSNSNNSAGFQRSSISNSLLQFPPPPPPSSQNQAKVSPITNQFQCLSLRFPPLSPRPHSKSDAMEANLSHFHSVSHALEWAHSAGHFNHTCDHFKL